MISISFGVFGRFYFDRYIMMPSCGDSFGLDRCVAYRANLMFATVNGASRIRISYPRTVCVTSCGNSASFNRSRADSTFLVLGAILGTSGVGINLPLAVGMSFSGNSLGLNGGVTGGTNLVFAAIFGTSSVGINNPFTIGVARRNIVLCYERFATNGTMLTFGLAVRGASSSYSGINNFGMTKCINALRFLFTTRAGAFLFALNGTSRILDSSPLTKSVNVSIRFGFRCIIRCAR